MTTGLTPGQRHTRAVIAASSRWASEENRERATRPARTAFLAKFERQVDPDGTLTPDERAKRARLAMRAHMSRIALKSSQRRKLAAT